MTSELAPSRTGDRIAAALVVALAAAMFAATLDFPEPGQPTDPGTAAFPRLVAVAMGLLAIAALLRPERVRLLPHRRGLVRVAGAVALSVGYGFALELIGFLIPTAVFLAASLLLMGVRRPIPMALTVIAVPIVLYLLFSVGLEVYLPRGPSERILTP